MNKRTIIIEDYNPDWPAQYDSIKQTLAPILGDLLIAIHHIGSTSIPNLSAKPIIDIIAVVKDITQVDSLNSQLHQYGFIAKGESGMPLRRFFIQGEPNSTCNLHIYDHKSDEPQRHLCFRNYLRTHPTARDQYAQLKKSLAQTNPHDILEYINGKEAFVFDIDQKSGYHGVRMVRPITHSEIKHYRTLMGSEPNENYSLVFFHDTHLVGAMLFDQQSEIVKLKLNNVTNQNELEQRFCDLFYQWQNTQR